MHVNKSLVVFCLSGLALMAGTLMHKGCPTPEIDSQHTSLQCGRMGYYKVFCAPPNATAIEELGNRTLKQWNVSRETLEARYAALLPDGIARFADVGSGPCLSNSASRSFYNNATSAVSSWLSKLGKVDIVEKAHLASTLRAEARKVTRDKMCDQAEVRVLKERDLYEYGTKELSFPYVVGKYAKKAMLNCTSRICDIKKATCAAIIGGAEKTNAIYNWVASFF